MEVTLTTRYSLVTKVFDIGLFNQESPTKNHNIQGPQIVHLVVEETRAPGEKPTQTRTTCNLHTVILDQELLDLRQEKHTMPLKILILPILLDKFVTRWG